MCVCLRVGVLNEDVGANCTIYCVSVLKTRFEPNLLNGFKIMGRHNGGGEE